MKKVLLLMVIILLLTATLSLAETSEEFPNTVRRKGQGNLRMWEMLGHDPAHTGSSTSPVPDYSRYDPHLNKLVTELSLTGEGYEFVESSVIVSDNEFFVQSNKYLYAFDSPGNLLWYTSVKQGAFRSPAYSEGRVVYLDHEYVYCRNAGTGDLLWKFNDLGRARFGGTSSVMISAGKVWISSESAFFKATAYALDLYTGMVLSALKFPDFVDPRGFSQSVKFGQTPAIMGDMVYWTLEMEGTDFGALIAIDQATGSEIRWSFSTGLSESFFFNTPTVIGDQLFVTVTGSPSYLVELDRHTGDELWRAYLPSEREQLYNSNPVIYDGKVIVPSTDWENSHIYAFDRIDGSLAWKIDLPGEAIWSSASVGDGVAIIGTGSADMMAFSPEDGSILWKHRIARGNGIFSTPSLAEGRVYVGGEDDNIYILDPMDSASVEADIDITPKTLNVRGRGKYISARIEVEGYHPDDVLIESILLQGNLRAVSGSEKIGDSDRDGVPDLTVKFSRGELLEMLVPGYVVDLKITGYLSDGKRFEGIDTARVIG
ncbi:MAG: PQQ-binding-like beta-propeller repeat protein [Thermoplasmata archaeon]